MLNNTLKQQETTVKFKFGTVNMLYLVVTICDQNFQM